MLQFIWTHQRLRSDKNKMNEDTKIRSQDAEVMRTSSSQSEAAEVKHDHTGQLPVPSAVCVMYMLWTYKHNSCLLSNTEVTQHRGRGLHSREDHSSEEDDGVMSHSAHISGNQRSLAAVQQNTV